MVTLEGRTQNVQVDRVKDEVVGEVGRKTRWKSTKVVKVVRAMRWKAEVAAMRTAVVPIEVLDQRPAGGGSLAGRSAHSISGRRNLGACLHQRVLCAVCMCAACVCAVCRVQMEVGGSRGRDGREAERRVKRSPKTIANCRLTKLAMRRKNNNRPVNRRSAERLTAGQ